MSDISMSDTELLKYAVENGIIDTALVQEKIEMQKREELLNKHPYKIYQGKDGKWYTYLPCGDNNRKKVKGTSRESVENKVVCYWREKEENPSIGNIFYEWVDQKLYSGEISKATYDRYIIDFEKYFTEISDEKIKDLDECFVEDYIRRSIHKFEMTAKSFSNFRTLVYGVFKYAKRKKYISFSITYTLQDMEISARAFKKVVHKSSDQVYMPQEKDKMETYLIENQDIINLGLLFMFKTGVRVGELASLKVCDVDNYTVAINSTETRYKDEDGKVRYEVKDFPKSEAGLRFAILPEKYEWIMDEILKRNPNGHYLFEKDGNRIKTYSFRRRLGYICDSKLSMNPKSPHKIRKTYGSILLDGNVRESTILDTMGHSEISCTKEHYYFDRSGIEDKRKELGLVKDL